MRKRLAEILRARADVLDPPVENTGFSPAMDRSGAALSLLDDECLGFFMLQVRDGEPMPEVLVAGDVSEEYWRAIGVTLHQVARVAYGVRY